jgi:hypothetical protein
MHNLVVYGREGDEYLISDPVFEQVVRCRREDLQRARFAQGALAPNGSMYWLESVPQSPDLSGASRAGMLAACRAMIKLPIPFLGVRGISFLAGRLEKWPKNLGEEKALLYLGQLIRMQEEIGTGGAGFRFMYAAFLQEAAEIGNLPPLRAISDRMTGVGDIWRAFAAGGARLCKRRAKPGDTFPELASLLRECARQEKAIYTDILELLR